MNLPRKRKHMMKEIKTMERYKTRKKEKVLKIKKARVLYIIMKERKNQ